MTTESGKNEGLNYFSDEELVRHYRKHRNTDAIGILFKRYSHLVFGVCMHYLYDRERAADAVMSIYSKLFDSLIRHEVSNFKAWLCTVSKNHCLMQLRKSSSRRMVLFDELIEIPDVQVVENDHLMHLNNIETDKKIEKLLASVVALNPLQQQCIRLFYLESFSYEKIASISGLSLAEVKSHIQNGKRNLRLFMEGKKKLQNE